MASERISIRIPGKLGQRLARQSSRMGRSESQMVREALEAYLTETGNDCTAYGLAESAGVIGCLRRAPKDLSSNPRYLQGFGKGK